jgi:hypothetical protein
LRLLHINHCQLEDITGIDFLVLQELQSLDLSDNKLQSLPDSIQFARNLQFLSLDNNSFREIPSVLGILPSLKTLMIQGNPQRLIRTNIIAQGSVKIIQYLRERHSSTTPPQPPSSTRQVTVAKTLISDKCESGQSGMPFGASFQTPNSNNNNSRFTGGFKTHIDEDYSNYHNKYSRNKSIVQNEQTEVVNVQPQSRLRTLAEYRKPSTQNTSSNNQVTNYYT